MQENFDRVSIITENYDTISYVELPVFHAKHIPGPGSRSNEYNKFNGSAKSAQEVSERPRSFVAAR